MYEQNDFLTGNTLAFEINRNNTNHLILRAKEPEKGSLSFIGTLMPLSICLNQTNFSSNVILSLKYSEDANPELYFLNSTVPCFNTYPLRRTLVKESTLSI